MTPLSMQQATLLGNVRSIVGVDTTPFDQTNEWLQLRSVSVRDYELYQQLRFRWPQIAGPFLNQFALVLCKSPPNAGVWLHHLSDAALQRMYPAGCFEVAAWSQQNDFRSLAVSSVFFKK
jgi:hypothetical protein